MSIDTAEGGVPPVADTAPPTDASPPQEAGPPSGDESTDATEERIGDEEGTDEADDRAGSAEVLRSSDDEEEAWDPDTEDTDDSQAVAAEQTDDDDIGDCGEPTGGEPTGGEPSEQATEETDQSAADVDETKPEAPSIDDEASQDAGVESPPNTDELDSADEQDVDPNAAISDEDRTDPNHDGTGQGLTGNTDDTEPEADTTAQNDDTTSTEREAEENPNQTSASAETAGPETDSDNAIDSTRPSETVELAEQQSSDEPQQLSSEQELSAHHESTEQTEVAFASRLGAAFSFADEMLNTQQGANVIGWVDREVFHNAEAIQKHRLGEAAQPQLGETFERPASVPPEPRTPEQDDDPLHRPLGGVDVTMPAPPDDDGPERPEESEDRQDLDRQIIRARDGNEEAEGASPPEPTGDVDEPEPDQTRHEWRAKLNEVTRDATSDQPYDRPGKPPDPDTPEPGSPGRPGPPPHGDGPDGTAPGSKDRPDEFPDEPDDPDDLIDALDMGADATRAWGVHLQDAGQAIQNQSGAIARTGAEAVESTGDRAAEVAPNPTAEKVIEKASETLADVAEDSSDQVNDIGKIVEGAGKMLEWLADSAQSPAGKVGMTAAGIAATSPEVWAKIRDVVNYFDHLSYRGKHRG